MNIFIDIFITQCDALSFPFFFAFDFIEIFLSVKFSVCVYKLRNMYKMHSFVDLLQSSEARPGQAQAPGPSFCFLRELCSVEVQHAMRSRSCPIENFILIGVLTKTFM